MTQPTLAGDPASVPDPSVEAAPAGSPVQLLLGWVGRGGILIPLVVTFVALAFMSPSFLRFTNLLNILDQQSAILTVAAAGTLVLICGGLDLSVGATYALAGTMATQLTQTQGPVVGITVGLLLGLAVGLANGIIVTRFRINSLIATLAMSYVVTGIAVILTKGNLVVTFDHPEFKQFAATRIFGFTSASLIMIASVVVLAILLGRTAFGRYVYATGGNAEAARLAGVRTNGIRVAAFAISGVAASLGGIIDASRVLSMQASSGGFLAFTVLAGIVVGGTSILGGEGAVWRTVAGCLFIAMIGNGFNLLGLDPFYQQITLGLILLAAVGIDAWSRRHER
ncbi:MAG: ribose transport system permease protein [Chloroflexota bacterium]|jgi:ribose transport system permease protein|nr:ribose transport system permease protein [Chloroflexota bacterium]